MGIADSALRDHVVFVEGAPRSGTTLLVSLLSLHADVAGVGNESHLFDRGVDRLFENYDHPDRRFLSGYLARHELIDLARDLCDGVLLRMRSDTKPDASFVVEKTPIPASSEAVAVMSRKITCYPDAWFVHIVRDGRDVARSLARMPWMHGETESRCYDLWKGCVAAIRQQCSDRHRYRELTYERLVADPAGTVNDIVAWIGAANDSDYRTKVHEAAGTRYDAWANATRRADEERTQGSMPARRRLLARAARRVVRRVNRLAQKEHPMVAAEGFIAALRDPTSAGLREWTTDSVSLSFISPTERLIADGDEARRALEDIGSRVFRPRLVSESWTAAAGTWMTADPVPSITAQLWGRRGDGTPVDMVLALGLKDGRVHQAALVVPMDLRRR
jgi:hypothetical protein